MAAQRLEACQPTQACTQVRCHLPPHHRSRLPARPTAAACLPACAIVPPDPPAGSKCQLQPGGYTCPRCKARVGELPSSCHVCGLSLVSSPHLARSYHHLFPVKPFAEVPAAELASAGPVSGLAGVAGCKICMHPCLCAWTRSVAGCQQVRPVCF